MTHNAKIDWWIAAALAIGILSPFVGCKLWITAPLFLAVGICGYPQHYRTTDDALIINSGLIRKTIPFEAITFVGRCSEDSLIFALSLDRVVVRYGANSGVLIAPADCRAFLADIAVRAPHLTRRGQDSILTYS